MFFEEVNRAVDGHQMHAGINLLRALQNLVHVQVLLGVIILAKSRAAAGFKRSADSPALSAVVSAGIDSARR